MVQGNTAIRRLKLLVAQVQDFYRLTLMSLAGIFGRPAYFHEIARHMDGAGTGSIGIVVIVSVFIGMALSLQIITELSVMGLKMYTGQIIGTAIISEIGPVIIAIVYAGRVGSGTASELGSMKLNRQVDALRVYGVDPVKKLVIPRVIGGVVVLPALTFIGDVASLSGGAYIAVFIHDQSPSVYWNQVRAILHPRWILPGGIKPLVFGLFIALISCYTGIAATGGSQGLQRATTRAFVNSVIMIIILDFVVTRMILFFMGNM
ncbi:MAG: ABC transporter permease [Chitinivibrionales bacterium]|nr:ABC transporter permease [Chitinivibrionales bacterium]